MYSYGILSGNSKHSLFISRDRWNNIYLFRKKILVFSDNFTPAPVKISDNFPPAPVKISDNLEISCIFATDKKITDHDTTIV